MKKIVWLLAFPLAGCGSRAELEKEIAALRARQEVLDQESATLRARNDWFDRELRTIKDRKAQLEAERAALTERAKQLEHDAATEKGRNRPLEDEVASLEERNTKLARALAVASARAEETEKVPTAAQVTVVPFGTDKCFVLCKDGEANGIDGLSLHRYVLCCYQADGRGLQLQSVREISYDFKMIEYPGGTQVPVQSVIRALKSQTKK